jgi:phage terminase large subunit GpA-like protein
VRNEALDCEVYCLHAARSVKVHLMHEAHWTAIEQQLRQRPMFAPAAAPDPVALDDDEEIPPPPASVVTDANTGSDNPAPGKREAAEIAEPPAPVHARAQPGPKKKTRKPPRGGYSVNHW